MGNKSFIDEDGMNTLLSSIKKNISNTKYFIGPQSTCIYDRSDWNWYIYVYIYGDFGNAAMHIDADEWQLIYINDKKYLYSADAISQIRDIMRSLYNDGSDNNQKNVISLMAYHLYNWIINGSEAKYTILKHYDRVKKSDIDPDNLNNAFQNTNSTKNVIFAASMLAEEFSNSDFNKISKIYEESTTENKLLTGFQLIGKGITTDKSYVHYMLKSELNDAYRPYLEMMPISIYCTDSDISYRSTSISDASLKNLCNLGSSDNKWNAIYAVNGTIQTSDRTQKNSITPLDDEETKKFIMGLIPSHYKMNQGSSGRTHYGLIAQDIEDLMNSLNMESTDFAGFIKSPKYNEIWEDENGNQLKTPQKKIIEGEYDYSLRYDEFISPMIKMIQMQQKTIESLEARIKVLEDQNNK